MTQHQPLELNFLTFTSLAFLAFTCAIALSELYATVQLFLQAEPAWLIAALVNSALALFVVGWWHRCGFLRQLLAFNPAVTSSPNRWCIWLTERSWRAYYPAIGVLVGVLFLIGMSRLLGGESGPSARVTWPWAWVTWIPLIEELVFRVGLGEAFRRRGGIVWGSWFSALAFALVHTSPTLANVWDLKIGLPLGPFFLGLSTEALLVMTRRLWPGVLLHAVCNLTVPIFELGDERWLQWLRLLYT